MEGGKGKNSGKKKNRTEANQQPEQTFDDNSEQYNDDKEDWQIVDFDKLINMLKYEKKMVEICIPQSVAATNKNKVCV